MSTWAFCGVHLVSNLTDYAGSNLKFGGSLLSARQTSEGVRVLEDCGIGGVKIYHLPAPPSGKTSTTVDTSEASTGESVDYSRMTKGELSDIATERGIDVTSRMTKADIMSALEG